MSRFMLIFQVIIVVLQKMKMKITHPELREKLSDTVKIFPKSRKSSRTD